MHIYPRSALRREEFTKGARPGSPLNGIMTYVMYSTVMVITHALFTIPPTVIQFALVSAMPNARGKGLQFLYAQR